MDKIQLTRGTSKGGFSHLCISLEFLREKEHYSIFFGMLTTEYNLWKMYFFLKLRIYVMRFNLFGSRYVIWQFHPYYYSIGYFSWQKPIRRLSVEELAFEF